MLGAFLVIFSVLAFLAGLAIIAESTSVLHEMLAGILFIISAIFFTGAFIVAEIGSSKTKQVELLTQIKELLRKQRLKKYPDNREDDK